MDYAIVDLGLSFDVFWSSTPFELKLLGKRKDKEYRLTMERKAWELSMLLSVHSKNGIKQKDIFDYDKLTRESEKSEEQLGLEAFGTPKEINDYKKSQVKKALENQAMFDSRGQA